MLVNYTGCPPFLLVMWLKDEWYKKYKKPRQGVAVKWLEISGIWISSDARNSL